MKKTIVVDCKLLVQRVSGISGYFLPYLKALTEELDDCHFILLSPTPLPDTLDICWERCTNQIVSYSSQLPHPYFREIDYGMRAFPRALEKIDADLLISPYYDFLIPKKYISKSIITVHDLCYWDLPDHYKWHTKWFPYFVLPRNLKLTGAIITGSEFGKSRLISRFQNLIGNKKIEVLYSTFEKPAPKQNSSVSKAAELKRKLELKAKFKYLLYTGGVENRKNLKNMFSAFRSVAAANPVQLVVTGNNKNHPVLLRLLSEYELESKVVLTGILSAEEIDLLYSEICHGALNLSLYEGFGRNTYESKLHGLPVLCSDISVTKEVGGDYPVYCDPLDVKDISEKMMELLQEKRREPLEEIDTRFQVKPNTDRMIRFVERCISEL